MSYESISDLYTRLQDHLKSAMKWNKIHQQIACFVVITTEGEKITNNETPWEEKWKKYLRAISLKAQMDSHFTPPPARETSVYQSD